MDTLRRPGFWHNDMGWGGGYGAGGLHIGLAVLTGWPQREFGHCSHSPDDYIRLYLESSLSVYDWAGVLFYYRHTPSVAFRQLSPKGCGKPVLGVCAMDCSCTIIYVGWGAGCE